MGLGAAPASGVGALRTAGARRSAAQVPNGNGGAGGAPLPGEGALPTAPGSRTAPSVGRSAPDS